MILKKRFNHCLTTGAVLLALNLLTGCSVYMAATPNAGPNFNVLKKGTPRAEVEQELGKPRNFIRKRGGDVASYKLLGKDEANYSRAATYAVLDIFTLCIAEIITSPMEVMQSDTHDLRVIYDYQGRVRKVEHTLNSAPLNLGKSDSLALNRGPAD